MATCKYCGQKIQWLRQPGHKANGKLNFVPFNPETTTRHTCLAHSVFTECPGAKKLWEPGQVLECTQWNGVSFCEGDIVVVDTCIYQDGIPGQFKVTFVNHSKYNLESGGAQGTAEWFLTRFKQAVVEKSEPLSTKGFRRIIMGD